MSSKRQPVNVNVGVSVGYVIDTSRRRRDAQGNPIGTVMRPEVIEGEAVEAPGE